MSLLLAACSGTGPAQLGGGCTINSDCNSPLVCAFQLCHNECKSDRDCPAGENCIESDRPYDVCQLPSEAACTYNSQCPVGETCAVDNQCRDQCQTDRDCVSGQLCVSGGVCADPAELTDAGTLPPAHTDAGMSGSGGAGAGLSCLRNSDCGAGGLICRQGACVVQCVADVDCLPPEGPGGTCVDNVCVVSSSGSPPPSDAGTVSDAGASSDAAGVPACVRNSDCGDAGLVCRQGACSIECATDNDCVIPQGPGGVCIANRC